MTKDEAMKQAKILVTVLLTDGVISKQEAEILRKALEQSEQEQFFYGQDPNVLPAPDKGESRE